LKFSEVHWVLLDFHDDRKEEAVVHRDRAGSVIRAGSFHLEPVHEEELEQGRFPVVLSVGGDSGVPADDGLRVGFG
jgi:hypothetical protein